MISHPALSDRRFFLTRQVRPTCVMACVMACVLGVFLLWLSVCPSYSESGASQNTQQVNSIQVDSIQLVKAPKLEKSETGKNQAGKKLSIVIESRNGNPVTTVEKTAQGVQILLSPPGTRRDTGLTYQGSNLLSTPDQQWVGQVVSKDGTLKVILPHLSPGEVSINVKNRGGQSLKSGPAGQAVAGSEPAKDNLTIDNLTGENLTTLLSPYLSKPSVNQSMSPAGKKGQIPPPPQFYFPEWKPSSSVVSLKELSAQNFQPKPPRLPMGLHKDTGDTGASNSQGLNSWFLPPPELNPATPSSDTSNLATEPSTAASVGPSATADPAPFKQLDSGTVSSQDSSSQDSAPESTTRFKQPANGLNAPIKVAGLTFPLWVLTVLTLCFGGLGIFGLCGGLVFLKILIVPFFPEKSASPEKSVPETSAKKPLDTPLTETPSPMTVNQADQAPSPVPSQTIPSQAVPSQTIIDAIDLPDFSHPSSIETAVKLSLMLKSISKNRPMKGLPKKETGKKSRGGHIPFYFAQ